MGFWVDVSVVLVGLVLVFLAIALIIHTIVDLNNVFKERPISWSSIFMDLFLISVGVIVALAGYALISSVLMLSDYMLL